MNIHENFDLSTLLWYKVGGRTRYLLEAESESDIQRALDFVEKNSIRKMFVCGLGSNLIFSDAYFDGAVIRIAANGISPNGIRMQADGTVEIFAGEILDKVIHFAFAHSLVGLEWAGGLPGTVGAGVRGNVGAFGGEIRDSFVSAKVLAREKSGFTVQEIRKENFHFSYRNSIVKEQKNLVVLSTKLHLKSATRDDLDNAKEVYAFNLEYRKIHHPIEYPTCGSVFKNIAESENIGKILAKWPDVVELVKTKWHGKIAMGYVIHRLGLTGYTVGKMQVSEKHSNFIVNLGGGKASEVLAIIKEIQERVLEMFGFVPEVEVEVVS